MIWVLRVVLIVALLFITGLTAIQAFLRYGFESSIHGAEELTLLAAVWLYFIGMAYATAVRDHVGGGLGLKFLERGYWPMVRVVVCAVVAVIFTYFGWKLFESIYENDFRTVSLALPKAFWVASFLVGSFLTSVYLVVEFVQRLRQYRHAHENE